MTVRKAARSALAFFLIIVICVFLFEGQARATTIADVSAAMNRIVSPSCFQFLGEPLGGEIRGTYRSAFPPSTTILQPGSNDELATAHLATVGRSFVPTDFVNGLLTDIPGAEMPSLIAAAAYDPVHHILGVYLARTDDNATWFLETHKHPSGISDHVFTWLRSSRFHIGIGSPESSIIKALGNARPLRRCGYEALTYHTGSLNVGEGAFGYTFVIRNRLVFAMRYTLGI
jgi:hypothetical protein